MSGTHPGHLGGGLFHPDPDALLIFRWNQAAEEAIAAKREANPWLGAPAGAGLNFDDDSFFSVFENGDIWAVGQRPNITATYIVSTPIRDRYIAIGRARSFIGHPISDQAPCLDGRGIFQRFVRGVIYWTRETGAWEVYGDILDKWSRLGSETSWLGYPLTGELPTPDGRMNSFERGQITWKAADRSTDATSAKDKMTQRFNDLGGIYSLLGLPLDNNNNTMDPVRDASKWTIQFRGGVMTLPFDRPAPIAVQTKVMELWWRGLECQVRQEGEDELTGCAAAFNPSTKGVGFETFPRLSGVVTLGPDNARIMPASNLLYEGAPTSLFAVACLCEVDDTSRSLVGTYRTFCQQGLPQAVEELDAPTGDTVRAARDRENIIRLAKFEAWTKRKASRLDTGVVEGGNDVYPAGVVQIPLPTRNPVRHTLRRADDVNTINWTDVVSVSAVDDGGDPGVYAFYFECSLAEVWREL